MIIIGHRGARGLAPENTLPSIQIALDIGVDEVEIDIRVTRDGVPVLSHNRSVLTAGSLAIIAHHTLAELRELMPELTTLAEALDLVSGKSRLHIEVKGGEPTQPVIDEIVLRTTETRRLALLLGSKNGKVLRELHTALPDVPLIVIEPWSGIRAAYRARRYGTKRISMRSWWLWSGFLRAMQRRGYQIVPYTMNDPAKVARWRPYIYGIVTDYPDRFVDKLQG